MEVRSGELLMDGLQQDVLLLPPLSPSLPPPSRHGTSAGWRRRLELGAVGEAEGGAIDQTVQSDERQGDGDGASQAAPTVGEDGDVRDDAEQRLCGPEREKQGERIKQIEDGGDICAQTEEPEHGDTSVNLQDGWIAEIPASILADPNRKFDGNWTTFPQ